MKNFVWTALLLAPVWATASDFGIADYGARADGTKCTTAFAKAMAAAEKAGGGRIVVPKGRWFAGPIHFRSNCELHLEKDAVVLFSQDPKDYLPAVPVSWEGIECWNYSPLVYAYGCTNIAITGEGTLRAFEGEFKDSFWKQWKDSTLVRPTRRLLYDWGATDYPVEKRRMTEVERPFLRPHLIHFNRCSGIRLEGFRIRESPFWTIHLYHSENAVVRGLDVKCTSVNNDGIDIDMTQNVLVERCKFDQGDDCFVLKAGRNRDAWRLGRPTANVEIRDCHIEQATSFFTCGSEISGGVRNVWMHDCSVGRCGRLCHIKTNRRRGAFVEGVRMERVSAERAGSVLAVETDAVFEWGRFPDYELKTTRIADISLKDVHVGGVMTRVDVQGDARLPVRGIRLEDVTVGASRTVDRLVNVTDVRENGRPLKTKGEFNVVDYGATPTDATAGIARTIAAAAAAGGGRVFVPGGTWSCGPIDLASGVELTVLSSTRLLLKDDPDLYRNGDGGYRPFIRAVGASDVRVSSGFYGIIEVLADGWKGVPASARPPLLGFAGCTNVVVDGVALHNAPAASVAVDGSRRVTVANVEFIAPVREDGFVTSRDTDQVFVGGSFRIGDGRLPPEDKGLRIVTPVLPEGVETGAAFADKAHVFDREVFVRNVNYDEKKVAPYELEDPLTFADGRKVTRENWPERRQEILRIFEREMYGRRPPKPEAVVTELVDEKVGAVAGYAIRRQYRMWFKADKSGPSVSWIVWIPRYAKGKVPVISFLNYNGNAELVPDGDIPLLKCANRDGKGPDRDFLESIRGRLANPDNRTHFPIQTILARGYAVMSACYGEISPDPNPGVEDSRFRQDPFAYTGVFELWGPRDPARTDDVTSLGAWSWALSRGLDLAERIPEIDASKSVVTGSSRLGKAAFLAGASDERFAVCVPNQCGGGGVTLAKRDFGENVSTENRMFTHWYCKAYAKHAEAPWKTLTFDQHLLAACVAPRALLVEGFDNAWFDTKGEFLALQAASPVWRLLGGEGLPEVAWPDPYVTDAVSRDLGYVRRTEEHGISAFDWKWTLDFADRFLGYVGI